MFLQVIFFTNIRFEYRGIAFIIELKYKTRFIKLENIIFRLIKFKNICKNDSKAKKLSIVSVFCQISKLLKKPALI